MRINTFDFAIIATVYSATIVCTEKLDCDAYERDTCVHGQHAECLLAHGSGNGEGEKNCECVHNGKRAGMCEVH